ncbi:MULTISPECIES: DUF5518 domain-containing protein [Methanoculleus]|uniref:Uncharacterized protein n=2 Tax=Methanoculleus TaxID=45989 RepID=A3CV99_METMJ|nr:MULTISPECIES: DUF5518 domain-containing protein [Methanoculleus]ABN57299.1 hypothetical protein Memar_1370 [Methanoculleus marisnigri JR1]UYU18710.1 DUF5518 domain-containing protein [Methanoculleus submarinus]
MTACAVGRWKGAVLGALVIGAVSLLGRSGLLPDPVMTVAFLFCGGLVAGLFTPGTIRDGALSGAVCGVIVALIMASGVALMSLVESSPRYPPPWMTFLFYALILTALFLPYNAVGGAAGTAVRNGLRRSSTGEGERGRWVGIGIGTAVIAGSSLFVAFLGPLLLAPPLVGGFIAGYAAGPRPEDGLEAGLVAALFGTGLFLLPFLWTASHAEGFVAGLAGMAAIALGLLFPLLGTAAGVAGAVFRASFGKEQGRNLRGPEG